jgi:GrpB-like predicted nucleotidyltransferase (UPF0157 family)
MSPNNPSPRTITIEAHNPAWATAFADLTAFFEATLGELLIRAEHVGSTSVKGLPAKPVVDLDLVIDRHKHLDAVLAALSELGYEHRGDLGIPGREAFTRRGADVPRDGSGRQWPPHHLYVCDVDSDELARHLAFRDHLRAHPDAARRYGELKRRLAADHHDDIDAYCSAKTDFICGVLAEAAPGLVEDARQNNLNST